MNNKKILAAVAALLLPVAMQAQYPQITDEGKHVGDSLSAIWSAHSDSAWAIALPIVMQEAQNGRPYVPWASRPWDLQKAKIPAFPGAEGGGMWTVGGRGGKVLTVTNLNDDGPGSFRWACEQGGARIVVFNVSGIIRLKSPISVRAPYITIAGQTAPGDGVCIAGETFAVNTHDVIVRHMRFRRGETNVLRRDDCFGGNPVGNIMIDHCSCEWGLDENISFYRHMFSNNGGKTNVKYPTVNVTIQNTISAKALDTWNHAFGSTIGGENTAFIRNLWADNTGRNPSVGWAGVFNFVNNVIFNYVNRTCDGGQYESMYNMINNYYKPGPLTPNGDIKFRIIKPESRYNVLGYPIYGRVYANGNIVEGVEKVTKDNWDGGVQPADDPLTQELKERIKSDEPFEMPYLTMMSAQEAYDYVTENVGATLPCRDIIDKRVLEEVKTGKVYYEDKLPEVNPYGDMTYLHKKSQNEEGLFKYRRLDKDSYKKGIITSPAQMGGYPEYKGKAYKDSDGDGMPDAWEKANGLDPNDPSDANKDCTGDGYTNIEKYINGISTKTKTDWTDMKNNHDTLTKRLVK